MRNLSKIICATIFQLYHKCFSAIGYRTHFYNPENFGGYWGWQLLGIDKGSLKLWDFEIQSSERKVIFLEPTISDSCGKKTKAKVVHHELMHALGYHHMRPGPGQNSVMVRISTIVGDDYYSTGDVLLIQGTGLGNFLRNFGLGFGLKLWPNRVDRNFVKTVLFSQLTAVGSKRYTAQCKRSYPEIGCPGRKNRKMGITQKRTGRFFDMLCKIVYSIEWARNIWRRRENRAKRAQIMPKWRSRAPDGSAPLFFRSIE